MEEPIEQLPQADWVDQDLLTRDLAGSLLDEEIAAESDRLARLGRGESGDDIVMSRADMERRLAAMIAVRDNVGQNTSGQTTP
ncbi:hypothetical protein FXW78_13500 [Rhodococcus opacus]|nr:hypothetical protein [Rhodococcus opacus]RZL83672.1 MAG: hypothetical protein EOP32_06720 [Rhodococcus sp. (in: high G+C Gram-positive bacteria)]